MHSKIMTVDFLMLSWSIRTCVGVETVVSVLFLFHAVLTRISQLVRICIQSISCFSVHPVDFLWFEQNSLKLVCGTLSVFFFSTAEKYFSISAGLAVPHFTFCYLLKAPGAASTCAVKHLPSAD